MKGPENRFRDSEVVPFLKELPNTFYFIKEACSLRGLPDIMGCCNGRFFALELKASESEARKDIGRHALQKLILSRIEETGGKAWMCFPENFYEIKAVLELLAQTPYR